MRGRKANPDSKYHVILHVANGYRYAATVYTAREDSEDGQGKKRIRKYIHWGTVSTDNKFNPNLKYQMTPVSEREKLDFPQEWDISAATALNDAKHKGDQKQNEAETSIIVGSSPDYNNRLYGSVWFLAQIARIKFVTQDLMVVFEHNEETVNIVLTLAIFPYLTRRNFDRLARSQEVYRYPAETRLTSSYITRFTQHITDRHRMEFCKLRVERQPDGAYAACDSTTRTAWGNCLADIHFGRNKDNPELNCTLEVVVYSLTMHEPVYYRTFPGNMPDARTVQAITDDMQQLGAGKLITIYDRGYESADNFDEFFRKDFPFIACAKVAQEPVIDCLLLIKYDAEGVPENMQYDEETKLFYTQFMLQGRVYRDSEGNERKVEAGDYRCNVYLDPTSRLIELQKINEAIRKESMSLQEQSKDSLVEQKSNINRKLRFHKVVFTEKKDTGEKQTDKWEIEITRDAGKIRKEKATCGFFSSVTYKAEGNALEMLRLYKTRDEQEKYFEQMKDQMDFHTQDASSEDGKAGREFILFVGLILSSMVRNTWKQDVGLRKQFNTSLAILDEMEKIRLYEYPDGSQKMTPFVGAQLDICRAFGIQVPAECLPAIEKQAAERKKNPGKRGRKPKGAEAAPAHKITPIQIGV